MTPRELSIIHDAAFTQSRPWSEAEFGALLSSTHTHLFSQPGGFALLQVVSGEAELLTIAVHPDFQRKGISHQLMAEWMTTIDATEAFLEVASDNFAARRLYIAYGFAEIAKRKDYYSRNMGKTVDAIVMRRPIT